MSRRRRVRAVYVLAALGALAGLTLGEPVVIVPWLYVALMTWSAEDWRRLYVGTGRHSRDER